MNMHKPLNPLLPKLNESDVKNSSQSNMGSANVDKYSSSLLPPSISLGKISNKDGDRSRKERSSGTLDNERIMLLREPTEDPIPPALIEVLTHPDIKQKIIHPMTIKMIQEHTSQVHLMTISQAEPNRQSGENIITVNAPIMPTGPMNNPDMNSPPHSPSNLQDQFNSMQSTPQPQGEILNYLRSENSRNSRLALSVIQEESRDEESNFRLRPSTVDISAVGTGDKFESKSAFNESKRSRKSRSSQRIGTILAPTKRSIIFNPNETRAQRLNSYLPIAIFLARQHNMKNQLESLLNLLKHRDREMETVEAEFIMDSMRFLKHMVRSILRNEETLLYNLFLEEIPNLVVLIQQEFFYLFEDYVRFDYLFEYFTKFRDSIIKQKSSKNTLFGLKDKFSASKNELLDDPEDPSEILPTCLTKRKIVLLIQKYMLCTQENEMIVEILKLLEIEKKLSVELFLLSREEMRFIQIAGENPSLKKYVDPKILIEKRLFKLFILFDKANLIDIFNEKIKNDKTGKKQTVYEELCRKISDKVEIEALCNVVISVHSTFWDMEKLPKFLQALSVVLEDKLDRYSEMNPEVGMNKSDFHSKSQQMSWLVVVQNPLLFSIKLIQFLKKTKAQLDFRNKEFLDLTKALVGFCSHYLKNATEEVLMINLFEKDSKGYNFLEYAFEVKELSLLEAQFIEGVIRQMWDLGRKTMQTVSQFMRLNFIKDDIDRFDMTVFTRKYEMPIETNDNFGMEFRFTSNSVYLRVVSEIFWPLTLILVEFVFSMRMIRYYRSKGNISKDWLSFYLSDNMYFGIVHLALRGSYIVSSIMKIVLLKMFNRESFLHMYILNFINFLYFIQMVILSLWLQDKIWYFNNVQALIVISLISYIFYNGLALNEIGVILRLFLRMVYVVLIFGTISCFIMLFIAYPIHSIYIDFSQKVDGQLFPEMNMFRDLYNGILTLFEFLFGSVVLVRPYLEENAYTYSMAFIMIIFSFFGNIMMANVLIAFLAKQLEDITRNAKYYTNRMQFELVKVFNMRDLDSIFVMPYPFVGFFLPAYMLMIKNGSLRKSTNLFLRKFIHFINVFIPTFVLMNIFLIALIPIKYVELLFSIVIKILLQPKHLLYLIAWVLLGPLLLLKLYIQDNITMIKITLHFDNKNDDMLDTNLSDETKKKLISIFGKLNIRTIHHLTENPTEVKLTISKFLTKIGMEHIARSMLNKKNSKIIRFGMKTEKIGNGETEVDEDEEEEPDKLGFAAKLNSTYKKDENKLIVDLLRRFAFQQGKIEDVGNMDLDLELMLEKFKNNINTENISRLIGFDLTTLYNANKYISNSTEMDVKSEIMRFRTRMNAMEAHVDQILNEAEVLKDMVDNRNARAEVRQ